MAAGWREKLTRRFVALIVAAAARITAGTSGRSGYPPPSASIGDIETPTVSGPLAVTADSTPWAATDKPLDDYGYVEQEFTYSGNAFRYDTTGDVDQTGTKLTTGGPADDGKFPYETRMIVRRPADPADFNGTVVVEWQNVTAGFDLEANWFGDPEYLLENGYAYVAISAQRVGVNFLRGWDADRYGDLDVSARDGGGVETITNDALSYDIYGAGIKALLDGGNGVDPLGPLAKPDTVIASGESQSGSRLSTYYNKIQPIHDVADAFLLTVSTSAIRARHRYAGDPRPERDREPGPADRARRHELSAVGGRRRVAPAADGVRELPGTDRAGLRIDAVGELPEVPTLAGAVAVRGQLGLRAPDRLGQWRRSTADRAARPLPGLAGRPEQPARARRSRYRPGRHPVARDVRAGSGQHRHQRGRSGGGGIFSAFCVPARLDRGSLRRRSAQPLRRLGRLRRPGIVSGPGRRRRRIHPRSGRPEADPDAQGGAEPAPDAFRGANPVAAGTPAASRSHGAAPRHRGRRSSSSTRATAVRPGARSPEPMPSTTRRSPSAARARREGEWIYRVRSNTTIPADAAPRGVRA